MYTTFDVLSTALYKGKYPPTTFARPARVSVEAYLLPCFEASIERLSPTLLVVFAPVLFALHCRIA